MAKELELLSAHDLCGKESLVSRQKHREEFRLSTGLRTRYPHGKLVDTFVVHSVIHRGSGVVTFDREASVAPHKTAKRPGVGAPWAASDPHPHGIEEGTLSESNGRYIAAVEHLAMLKSRRERALRDEVYYVQLGAKYGVSEADIVRSSGLELERVRHILAGGS